MRGIEVKRERERERVREREYQSSLMSEFIKVDILKQSFKTLLPALNR